MKKYLPLLFLLLFMGCEKDIPNQLTIVHGMVLDYYSKQPISGIPVIIEEEGEKLTVNSGILP
jgi:hypothetical protein